jgi:phosphatidylserine decarboxylase
MLFLRRKYQHQLMKEYTVFNRKTKLEEVEVSGNLDGLNFLYHTLSGKPLTYILNKHFVSRMYARYVKSRRSQSKISNFVKQYQIDTSEVKQSVGSFTSLNNFFIRELKPGARPVDQVPAHLISPADARLLVFDLSDMNSLPVKGYWYSLHELLKDKALAKEFADGWCFVYRLAPMDYHRYCYIDSGRQDQVLTIKGVLHSVNPIAISAVKSLMAKNYRELTILHTDHFDKVLDIEVGAMMVGKVVQQHRGAYAFFKGEEKGWFEFGGSTIVQLFKKSAVIPDDDILQQSAARVETLVRMGEKVGNRQ